MLQDGAPNLLVNVADPGIRKWIDKEIAIEGGATYCTPCEHCK